MPRQYIQSIASQSLGRAWNHDLEIKLSTCHRYGYKAVEIFMEDLQYVAKALPTTCSIASPGTSFADSTEWDETRIAAAEHISTICVKNKLDVICLQPFMNVEGLVDRNEYQERLKELRVWMVIATRLRTDLIQIPSCFLPESQCTGDLSLIIDDLSRIADVGLQHSPPIRFAYEALCWGTHINTFDAAWKIVQAVDRPNFGTCLDTFNIAGRVYADPVSTTGRNSSAQSDMARSIEFLKTEVDVSKVFYVEVCDGERLDKPISPSHDWYVEGQHPRMTWSRNARLFPYEQKGYLPVMEILDAICDIGYEGYVAFELFSRTANAPEKSVPEDHARRGQQSWTKMMRHLESRQAKQLSSTKVDAIVSCVAIDVTQPNMARL